MITPLLKSPDDMFSMFDYIRGKRYEDPYGIDAEKML